MERRSLRSVRAPAPAGATRRAGDAEGVIRPAATVMLLRDGPSGLEVFVLERVAAMPFAAGMTVFPGGAVDPADYHGFADWDGPGDGWWARHLGLPAADARAVVVAAARELFEETGVLLAGPRPVIVSDQERVAILERRLLLSNTLHQHELRLQAASLRPWANWITPPGYPRRYDTFFFAAGLPDGQDARVLTSEATSGGWRTPGGMLEWHASGKARMLPPTLAMLADLAEQPTVGQALATAHVVRPVTRDDGGAVVAVERAWLR